MPIPLLVPLAIGAAGAIGKAIGRGKSNRKMDELLKQDPKKAVSPIAQERFALAKTLLNARMPGATQVQRNLYTNTANRIAGNTQLATDSSQALALNSQAYGDLGNQLTDLGVTEAQDYQRRFGNYVGAGDTMINEQDKVFEDDLRRQRNKFDVEGAKSQNRQNTWGDISNFGFSMANFGLSGGFDNMFKKGSGLTSANSRIPVPQLGGISRGSVGTLNLPNNHRRNVQIGE